MIPTPLFGQRARSMGGVLVSGARLHPAFTTARASAGWAFDSGVLRQYGNNVPRLTSRGLIVEGQSTTSTLRTQELSNASWNPFGLIISQTGATGPDGATASWLLTENGSGAHRLVQQINVSAGALAYATAIIAPGTRRYVNVFCVSGTAEFGAQLDTTTMTISGYQNGAGTLIGSRIEPLSNGFFEIDVWGTLTGITAYFPGVATSNVVYAGNSQPNFAGTSTLQIWAIAGGAGLPGTYLPASASAFTRLADNIAAAPLSVLGLPSTGCTLFGRARFLGDVSAGACLLCVDTGSNNDRWGLFASSGQLVLSPTIGGSFTGNTNIGATALGAEFGFAFAPGPGRMAGSLSGGSTAFRTATVSSASQTTLRLGGILNVGSPMFGTIHQLRSRPYIASDAELQALSNFAF